MLDRATRRQIDLCLQRIDALSEDHRQLVLPEVRALIGNLRARGEPVPPQIRELATQLHECQREAFFDNVPI